MDRTCAARKQNVIEVFIAWARHLFEKKQPSNFHYHALREFKALGYLPVEQCEDGPDKWIQENILELLAVFSKQGHSGFSAPYCVDMFAKLARFKPLCALTGESDEWNDVSNSGGRNGEKLYQNNRSGNVFKDDVGAWNIDGVIFEEPNGGRFTGFYSRVPVTFPYTPKSVVAHVELDATDLDKITAAKKALAAEPA